MRLRLSIVSVVAFSLAGCGIETLDVGSDGVPGRFATRETIRGEASAAPGIATVIASRQYAVQAIAADETRLYWSLIGVGNTDSRDEALREWGVVRGCDPENCAETLVDYANHEFRGTPLGSSTVPLLVSSGMLYWTRDSVSGLSPAVVRCPVTGCGGSPEVILEERLRSIAVDEGSMFWTGGSSGLFRCNLSDCAGTRTLLAVPEVTWSELNYTRNVHLDATNVYWTEGGDNADTPGILRKMPKDGSEPPSTMISDLHRPAFLFATPPRIDWVEHFSVGEVRSCALPDCEGGALTLATEQPYAALLAADASDAFWFTRRGRVWNEPRNTSPADLYQCAATGCSDGGPTLLSTDPKLPSGIAVTRTHVYWFNRGTAFDPSQLTQKEGAILRIRRKK